MITQIVWVVLGFTCLIFGANWLVEGASALAKKYRVPDLVIGLTIVAFGTSAPELVVSLIGSLKGYSDIVLGNVVGSNSFNLFVILGITGLILPIKVQSSTAWKEIPISLFTLILLLFLINDFYLGQPTYLSTLDSSLMLLLFLAFLYYVFTQLKYETNTPTKPTKKSALIIWGLITIGLAGLILGGNLVVNNSVKIANSLGVSEKIIGITIVAAGTSLPELVTAIVAATKKNSDIAIGSVIGSNVFNTLLILPISGIIKPIEYNLKFNTDLYFLIGGTVFLFIAMLTGQRKRLDRWEAAILLGFYLFYSVSLVVKEL